MNNNRVGKQHGGIAPYGYRWLNGRLEISDTEAEVRRMMCDLFLKHRRKKTVARILNELGYRTRNDALFSDTTIGRILADTTGMGTREVNGATFEVEPIISNDVWNQLNEILDGKKSSKQSIQLFTGFVVCSCSGKMTVPSGSSKYVCVVCRRKIPAEDLEEVYQTQLEHLWPELELHNFWTSLSRKERRHIVEQTCERIIVDGVTIQMEFGYSPHSFKTPTEGQQMEPSNIPVLDSTASSDSRPLSEPLLSESEAARFLGLSKMTLFRKRSAKEISFFRIGTRILYSREKHLIPFLSAIANDSCTSSPPNPK